MLDNQATYTLAQKHSNQCADPNWDISPVSVDGWSSEHAPATYKSSGFLVLQPRFSHTCRRV